jgi:DNA (cytosine-5)-methyltransferase 1
LHGKVPNLGDISKIKPEDVPDCDLITYSFPCQDLSVAGAQAGADEGSGTRSSLLWECKKIIEAKKPKYLLMENVKNLVGSTHKANFEKWLNYLAGLGYTNYWKVLNAVDYGAPQSRERVFVVSILGDEPFEFPAPQPRTIKLKDILDPDDKVPSNMYMNDRPFIFRETQDESDNGLIHVGNLEMAGNESIKRVYSPEGVCPTLTTMTGGHRQPKIYLGKEKGVRKLTPRECWAVMGFNNETYQKVEGRLSNTQLYKQAGNTICVPCLEAIFRQLFKIN